MKVSFKFTNSESKLSGDCSFPKQDERFDTIQDLVEAFGCVENLADAFDSTLDDFFDNTCPNIQTKIFTGDLDLCFHGVDWRIVCAFLDGYEWNTKYRKK